MIRVEPLTAETTEAVCAVELDIDQRRYVTTESVRAFIAQAHLHPTFVSYGIFEDDKAVGFVSVGHEPESADRWWIPLLVIDRRHQSLGYGRAALAAVIEMARAASGVTSIGLSYHPENLVATDLYRSLGFELTGHIDHAGHLEAILTFEPGG